MKLNYYSLMLLAVVLGIPAYCAGLANNLAPVRLSPEPWGYAPALFMLFILSLTAFLAFMAGRESR